MCGTNKYIYVGMAKLFFMVFWAGRLYENSHSTKLLCIPVKSRTWRIEGGPPDQGNGPIKGNHHDAAVWKFDYGETTASETLLQGADSGPKGQHDSSHIGDLRCPKWEKEVRLPSLPSFSTCWPVRHTLNL